MTPLGHILARQIRTSGPMRLDAYMAACLMHPQHGYYSTRDPLGAGGDFTTAPEISQMFGELVGLSLAQAWLDQGAPSPFTLAELGPGRGTLMADLLRATRGVPGFADALRLHLVETSPSLRRVQAQTLRGHRIEWCDQVDDLPEGPLFLVANEFFDALPVRQLVRAENGWQEHEVTLHDGALVRALAAPKSVPALAHREADTAPGDLVEICPMGTAIAATIGRRIAAQGGAAILVDYGEWRSLGDTFQALEKHRFADPMAHPGRADLTAHVDFEALAQAAAPCAHSRLTPQGLFLQRLGITPRAQTLAAGMDESAQQSHLAAYRRLTDPAEMGTLFKAMALYPDGATPPPGLDP